MSFSNPPGVTDFDGSSVAFRPAGPAGLRHPGLGPRHEADQPTGVFVAIEMAVLVLVCALAMVSVIVSTGEVGPDRSTGLMTEQGMSAGPRADNGAAAAAAQAPAATR